MLSPATDIKNTSQLVPVPRSLRQRLWYSLIAAGVFNVTAVIESMLRTGYDARQQAISALSLDQRGWIQMTSFILLGAVILSTVIFKQDPAPGYDPENLALTAPTLIGLIHLLFAGIGALSSIIGLIVMARRFALTPLWRGWAVYSILMAFIMFACVTVYSVWSTASTGYAGMFERIGLLILPIWALTFLTRLESGIPFMKGRIK
jgi:hypothetical protein